MWTYNWQRVALFQKMLGLVDARWKKPSTCESCGDSFTCGAALTGCWCSKVSLTAETRASLRTRYTGCLCRKCLERAQMTAQAD